MGLQYVSARTPRVNLHFNAALQDKALEVQMDFQGKAEAPTSQQQDGEQQQQQHQDEQREDVDGSVDLNEGGKIENKRWKGEDADEDKAEEMSPERDGQKQQEEIYTEGGIRQGPTELEGTKDDADECPDGERQQQQQQKDSEKRAAGEDAEEGDGGNVEVRVICMA